MISAPAHITVSAVHNLAAIESDWRALESEALPSIFQSWTWVGCLVAERYPEPVLLRAERDGRTVGLALLNRVRGRFGTERLLLNETGNPTLDAVYVEHNGVLLARDANDLLPECLRALLTAPVVSERLSTTSLGSRPLRLGGVDAAHLSAAHQSGRVRVLRQSVAPFVDLATLPPGPDGYLNSLSANTRYQIRRSDRSLSRLGEIEVFQAKSLDEGLAFLDGLTVLHQAAWSARGLPGAFSNPEFLRFHRALIARALPRGEVALLRIMAGRQVLGYLYNFCLNGNVVTYQSGFDYPAAAALAGPHAKPGLTCHYAAIQRARAEGAATYDFLAGSDRYKRNLTRAAPPIYWLEVLPRRSVPNLRPRHFNRVIPPPKPRAAVTIDQKTVSRENVLVLGDDTRGFLATVRSLGRQGLNVHVAPANFRSPALSSRYIDAIHELPPWIGNGSEWLSAIEALLSRIHFELVIPCTETTLLPLQRHRIVLQPLARLAIPDDNAISVLFDKYQTRELALSAGVPVAAGRLLSSGDTASAILGELGSPVVVKPRWSYSLQTLAVRGKVQVVHEVEPLARLMDDAIASETILEQFFPGQGVGVSVLTSRGRVLQAFEHHRVHELAGASFYRVSAPLNPEMVGACEAMLGPLSYTGVAMFEFKRNREGKWILLEINARPWGSMPLPLALGVDFPYRWYRLLVFGEEMPAISYRSGIYGRNFFPDLIAALAEAEAEQLNFIATTGFLMRRVIELLRPLAGREVHDVFVRDDPHPALTEIMAAAKSTQQRANRIWLGAVNRRRRQTRVEVTQALRRDGPHLLVLFLCQGNICRSPFAEALLRSRLGNRVRVASAGLMPQPGRCAPEFGILAAAAYNVDLRAHRSTWLTREAAESASVVVIFDEINRTGLFDRFPKLRTPVIALGDLAGFGNITDPINGGVAEFKKVYDQIAVGVAEFASLLRFSPL
jgi:protein-tyrosine-phosphatase/predicted ATP-grasp superfamily ATP-dependent carboligase